MKKALLFTLLISFSLGLTGLKAQEIQNGGFENWTVGGWYDDPDDWSTLNLYGAAGMLATTFKSDDAATGNYSCMLKSDTMLTIYTLPGAITLGWFDVDIFTATASIAGGIPFTERPEALYGNYKSYPVAGDFAIVSAVLTKYDFDLGKRDTIGVALQVFAETVVTWSDFNIPLQYASEDIPDTLNIFAVSSNMNDLKMGSILYLDNISFEPLGLNEYSSEVEASVFPNPASNKASFTFEKEVNAELNIYNTEGQLVASTTVKGLNTEVDLSNLASGAYYYAAYEKSRKISSGKIIINK